MYAVTADRESDDNRRYGRNGVAEMNPQVRIIDKCVVAIDHGTARLLLRHAAAVLKFNLCAAGGIDPAALDRARRWISQRCCAAETTKVKKCERTLERSPGLANSRVRAECQKLHRGHNNICKQLSI